MSSQLWGLLVGGALPAIFYGVSGVLAKTSANAGMSVGGHLIGIGVAVSIVGVVLQIMLPGPAPNLPAIAASTGYGLLWGLGSGCVTLALLKYQTPLSKLVPLYNMNTLVAVLLALVMFAEWRTVSVPQLLFGAVLVVLGGTLVSIA
ncbi:MAG: hypothetical protein F6J87_29685 [Spirulina sp. SIO3F2]|nr:hypothetical protein [Spirulina sp. SIO3F2]